MPTYLRRFYLKKLNERYKEESDQVKKAQKKNKGVQRAGIR